MQERLDNFRQYFAGILNSTNKHEKLKIIKAKDTLPINTGDFTLKEVEDAIKSFKNNKVPGPLRALLKRSSQARKIWNLKINFFIKTL